jgi:putative spermidine/putrescine transport system ATP-binding protein
MTFGEREIIGSKVEVRGLVKQFGELRAVDQLSLSIDAGSFLTLLGPSGSGKTTTLNLIAGFEAPTSGEVFVDGKPITEKPPHKRNIGIVFQNYALFPHMTVADNIAFPLQMRGMSRDSVREEIQGALQMVRLQGHEDRYPKQLSGGQQQRIALARALVFRPPLLLMDEPLGALDKKLREQMQIEIKHIQKRLGITVIYVTHDQEEALTMSDRIAILNHGQLEQESFPLEIYERPRNRFVADFIGETNLLEGKICKEGNQFLIELFGLGARFVLPPEMGSILGEISVSIRPEKLEIGSTGEDQPGFRGEVEELIYVGENTKYIVKTAGEKVVIKHQNRKETLLFKRGDQVTVRLNPADLTIFRKE